MIYLVRHGETVWNLEKRKQGHKDSPLTLKGIKQVQKVGQKLSKYDLNNTSCLVSPLFRAQQSASIISEIINIPFSRFKPVKEIQEHGFGNWEGLIEEEIDSNQLIEREKDRWNFVIPGGGESYQLLYDRVLQFMNSNKNKDLLVVTHDMVSRVIKGIYLGLDKNKIMNTKNNQGELYILKNNNIEFI